MPYWHLLAPEVLIALTRWVRLRLRAARWRQWKTQRRRRAALIALGVKGRLASNTAGSGLGPWHLARSKALSVGLSNKYFRSLSSPHLTAQPNDPKPRTNKKVRDEASPRDPRDSSNLSESHRARRHYPFGAGSYHALHLARRVKVHRARLTTGVVPSSLPRP
jgi:hypothetical protein